MRIVYGLRLTDVCVEQVGSNSITERAKGLGNLKHVLRQNNDFEALSDTSFHFCYESLFRVAVLEQSTLLKAKTTTTRSAAETRLSTCANALRLAVEIGVRTIKLKTVRSILDHLIETIITPGSTGSFCEPLATEYVKCLHAVLAYPPHVEHLSQHERERIAGFCVECVQRADSDFADDDARPGADAGTASGSKASISYRSSRSQMKEDDASRGSKSMARQIAEEMLSCLSLVVSASNFVVSTNKVSNDLLSGVIRYLRNTASAGRTRQVGFTIINCILSRSRTEDIELTKRMVTPILRLIQRYWSARKDEKINQDILQSLLLIRQYLLHGIKHDCDEAATLKAELAGTLDVIKIEYSKRDIRDILDMDDLGLRISLATRHGKARHVYMPIFHLRCYDIRSEANWTTVHLLATLSSLLMSRQDATDVSSAGSDGDEEGVRRPKKRRRTTNEFEELLQRVETGSTASRLCAAQTMTFLAQQRALTVAQLKKCIDVMCSTTPGEHISIASWRLVALASLASQAEAAHTDLARPWDRVYRVAIRAMSTAPTCRAACHLMHIMLRVQLLTSQHTHDLAMTLTTAMHLNGPAVIEDSVAHLLEHVIRSCERQSGPKSTANLIESVTPWLMQQLKASNFEDKLYAAQQALLEPADLVDLIRCCLGRDHTGGCHISRQIMPAWGPIAQVWLHCVEDEKVCAYLLLLDDAPEPVHARLTIAILPAESSSPQIRSSIEAMVLTHLLDELRLMHEKWIKLNHERPRSISSTSFASITQACLVAACVAFCSNMRDRRLQAQLRREVQGILTIMKDYIQGPDCEHEKVQTMLTVFSNVCSGLSQPLEGQQSRAPCEALLCDIISVAMRSRLNLTKLDDSDNEDVDALSSVGESQRSAPGVQSAIILDAGGVRGADFSRLALQARVTTYAAIVSKQAASAAAAKSGSSEVVDYILSLPDSFILLSRGVISSISQLGIELTTDDAYRLLDLLLVRFMDSYLYERSETALVAILDIIASLVSVWTTPANEALFELGIDTYKWFTSTALSGGALSPDVQRRLASFLLLLCDTDTDYGRDGDAPSVRTSLFTLLRLGTISVQFYLADRIPAIFGSFVLSTHVSMFDDLQQNLPSISDWVEGIAMRLFCLSRLASVWPSLLRPCVYYMFETAGQVKRSAQHAASSMRTVAAVLNFETPQKLFRLFAPQLLYSWLEGNAMANLPYVVFEYESLEELLRQNKSEVTAQLLTRGDDEGITFVLSALKLSAKELVVQSFAKCQAYCIAWDISNTSSDKAGATSEQRLRAMIGSKEDYKALVISQFPTTMAYFYLSLQNEDTHGSSLGRRSEYSAATKALADMQAFSHSDKTLPAGQQPSFKPKYLCNQIERLCRRTGHNPVEPWEPSSFALATRILLDSIEGALGPLHASQIIRELRLMISMAGDVALSGFPLEMLIHSLRQFLNDSQCADDVMGVLHYLFMNGQRYLSTNLSFVYGTVMLIILQMRRHERKRLDSTTQESQHRSTVQRMQVLQTWLVDYLENCRPPKSSSGAQYHSSFLAALATISLPGNARKDSPESSLLMLLLGSVSAKEEPFSISDRNEALLLLSDRFEVPAAVVDDCLAYDSDCAEHANQLWRVLQVPGLSEHFIAWASRVLGRAYAATGQRPSHSTVAALERNEVAATKPQPIAASKRIIAQQLSEMLFSRNSSEASLADHTLRRSMMSFKDAEDALAFEDMLREVVVNAMYGGTRGYDPEMPSRHKDAAPLKQLLVPSADSTSGFWAQSLSLALCKSKTGTSILPALTTVVQNDCAFALRTLSCIIHILLFNEEGRQHTLRTELSTSVHAHLLLQDSAFLEKQRIIIQLLLYLRTQPLPGESTTADRLRWLDVDWLVASQAAVRCGMPRAALMFLESTPAAQNRRTCSRASQAQISIQQIPRDLLVSICRNLEEPDSFYGVEQSASLDAVLQRLDYEADGLKSLMLRSAHTDARIRQSHHFTHSDISGMLRSLSMLNMNSLTFALLSDNLDPTTANDELLKSAQNLQQWDIATSQAVTSEETGTFSLFRGLSRASEQAVIQDRLRSVQLDHVRQGLMPDHGTIPSHEWFSNLASIIEVDEIINSCSQATLRSTWDKMQSRSSWMCTSQYENFSTILSGRHTVFSILAQNPTLASTMHVTTKQCRTIEIESLLQTARLARLHGQLQVALAATSQVSDLNSINDSVDVKAEVAAKFEMASVLWDLDESTASVKMLEVAIGVNDSQVQDIPVGRSELLAQLAHQLGQARLQKPEEILNKYLKPAISELRGRTEGREAGKVFHEFATFCDQQLQNSGNLEDFKRIAKLRQQKAEEVQELERLTKQRGTDKKESGLDKAQQWFEIDDADYQRLLNSRTTFVEQCLQNYMLALSASDEHDISTLRFFALWFENADSKEANAIVQDHLSHVPSWKFVVLLNQLMSRLAADESIFQQLLKSLATRICADHPYHSLNYLFASTRKPSNKDTAALSRYSVATSIRKTLANGTKAELLKNIFLANNHYHALAMEKTGEIRAHKISVKDLPVASTMVKALPNLHVPPATINLPLRPGGQYTDVPTISKFASTISFMSGLSRPKKMSALATDGTYYVQLFKSGKDDLRQDAIMEQVFYEVSKMLASHKVTRQRSLHVRTYIVIPLSTQSGIIEFVPNSMSFAEFLVPAHERYHPQDIKNNDARSKIAALKEHSTETKVKTFKKICEKFNPVLRHFFFEKFSDPDSWFTARTAYTRTTATISILGYVLGLGDRHCQNIMLDTKTGEVVHIDLGVAFEAGRVLPIPELVPFRLSRDVVDGFGITGVEGVFRRCCEFTLDALREDTDSIMTLLNVLRYDPLYTWTLSPVRVKRMQEETGRNAGVAGEPGEPSSKKGEQEAGEADRALSIVEKKLSKTLSTAATVNELIQQATDERHLATLFHGWSAWC